MRHTPPWRRALNAARPWPARLGLWAADYATIAAWQLRGLVPGPVPAGELDDARSGEAVSAGGPQAGIRPVDRAAPVVLIPGIYETWAVFRGLSATLRAAGHPVHAVRTLGYNHGPVREMSRRTARLLIDEDLRGVVLLAHSKGGLIGKAVMLDPVAGPRVAGMVAVATPFEGSAYARWFPVRSVRSLAPEDAGIRALAAERDANARIVSIYAAFDPHIPDGSFLPGAAANVEVPTTGHFRILADRRARAAVRSAVERLAG